MRHFEDIFSAGYTAQPTVSKHRRTQ